MSTQTPFPFMELPKELRLMVYERLPRQIQHVDLCGSRLIIRCLSVAIMCTSRDIHAEANGIVQKLLREYILESEPKIIQVNNSRSSLLDVFDWIKMQRGIVQGKVAYSIVTRDIKRFCRHAEYILAYNAHNHAFGVAVVWVRKKDDPTRIGGEWNQCMEARTRPFRVLDKSKLPLHSVGSVLVPNLTGYIPDAENIPVVREDNDYSGQKRLFAAMDKATWIEEWVPS